MLHDRLCKEEPKEGKGGAKLGGATNIKNGIAIKELDGQAYIVDIDNLQKIQLKNMTKPTEFADTVTTNTMDFFEY